MGIGVTREGVKGASAHMAADARCREAEHGGRESRVGVTQVTPTLVVTNA